MIELPMSTEINTDSQRLDAEQSRIHPRLSQGVLWESSFAQPFAPFPPADLLFFRAFSTVISFLFNAKSA